MEASADDLLPLTLWRRVLEALDCKCDVWAATAACRALRPLTSVLHGMLDWEALEEYYQDCCDKGNALCDWLPWSGPNDDPGPQVLEPGATVCIHLGCGTTHGGNMRMCYYQKGVEVVYRRSTALRLRGPANARGVLRALWASVAAECFRDEAHARLAGLVAGVASFAPDPDGDHCTKDGLWVRREVGPIVETEDETFDLGGLLPVPVTPEWLRQFEKYILPHPSGDVPLASVPLLQLQGPDPTAGITRNHIHNMSVGGSGLHCYLEGVVPVGQAPEVTPLDLAAAKEAVQPVFDPEELERLMLELQLRELLTQLPDIPQFPRMDTAFRLKVAHRLVPESRALVAEERALQPVQQEVQSLVVRGGGPPAPHERVYCAQWSEGALRPLADVLHGMLDWEALEEYCCCDEGKALDDWACWRGPDDDPGPLVLEPGATVCIHLGSGCSHGGVMYWLNTNKGVQLAYRCSSVLRIKGPADARGVLRALSASVFAECFREGAHGRLAGLCAQAAAFVPDPNGEHRGRDGLPVRRMVGPIVETEDETFDLRGLLPAPATPEWLRQFEKYITPCMHRDMPPYWPGGAPLSLGSVPMLALDGPDPVESALMHERINEMYDKGSGLHCYLERVVPARQARGSTLADLAAANEAVQPIFDPEELDRLWRESRMQKLLSDIAQMTLPQLKDRADHLRRLCQAIKRHPLQQEVQSLVVRSAGPPAPHERVYCALWGEGCA